MTPPAAEAAARPAGKTVDLSFVIHAERSTVFRFFSDPARFARWWACPGGGKATLTPRVGGPVRIEYAGPQGPSAIMAGEVVEMVPDERFVMTWGFESGNPGVGPGGSRVEITLKDHPEGTTLRLRHTGLPPEQAAGHESGWRHYMSVMATECSTDQFGAASEQAVAAWFEAWSTPDAGARRAVLERAVEPDGEFRDPYTCVRGVDALNAHIGNALAHMPGLRTERSGQPQLSHGYVRVAWRVVNPTGQAVYTGQNMARLSLRGRIDSLIGFWNAPGANLGE